MGVPQICFRMDNHSFQRRIWGYPQFRKPLDPLDEKMMIQPKSRDFKTDYGEGTEPFLWRYTPWLAWVIGPQGLRSLDHKSWLPSLNVWGNSLCSVIPRLGEVVLLCFKLDDACISSGCSEVLRFWTQPILPDYFQNRRSKAFRKLPPATHQRTKMGCFGRLPCTNKSRWKILQSCDDQPIECHWDLGRMFFRSRMVVMSSENPKREHSS